MLSAKWTTPRITHDYAAQRGALGVEPECRGKLRRDAYGSCHDSASNTLVHEGLVCRPKPHCSVSDGAPNNAVIKGNNTWKKWRAKKKRVIRLTSHGVGLLLKTFRPSHTKTWPSPPPRRGPSKPPRFKLREKEALVSRRRRRPTVHRMVEDPCARFDFRSLPRTQRFGDLYRPDTREQKTRNANRVQTRDQCGCPRPFSLLHSRICRCPSDSYDFVRQDLCETSGGGIPLECGCWLIW